MWDYACARRVHKRDASRRISTAWQGPRGTTAGTRPLTTVAKGFRQCTCRDLGSPGRTAARCRRSHSAASAGVSRFEFAFRADWNYIASDRTIAISRRSRRDSVARWSRSDSRACCYWCCSLAVSVLACRMREEIPARGLCGCEHPGPEESSGQGLVEASCRCSEQLPGVGFRGSRQIVSTSDSGPAAREP
jgi:hypothetical protein